MPFIEYVDDLCKLKRYECLTVIQCVLLFIAYNEDNIEDSDEVIYVYYTLAMLDIAKGELVARHGRHPDADWQYAVRDHRRWRWTVRRLRNDSECCGRVIHVPDADQGAGG